MDVLLEFTKELGAILELSRDTKGNVDPNRLNKTDKIKALEVMCRSFSYILKENLIEDLFSRVQELCKELDKPNLKEEALSLLNFFDAFLAYEEKMFKIKNLPSSLVKDAFGSTKDIEEILKLFVSDPEYRKNWTKTDGLRKALSRICETVCTPANDEALNQLLESRFILVGLSAAAINTAADMATGLLIVFNIISTGGGAIIAWKRANW